MKKQRFVRIITYTSCILIAGLLYGIFVSYTGIAIPCPIYTTTGFQCPGCGATRMCLALMRFDFRKAFLFNPVLFLLIVPLGAVFLGSAVTYVQDGSKKLKRWQHIILYSSIVLLLGHGVVRNFL